MTIRAFLGRLGFVRENGSFMPSEGLNGVNQPGKADSGIESPSSDTVVIGGKEYPKWAVEKAKRLLPRVGHNDLERLIESALVVRDRLENAVLADSDEVGQAVSGRVVILPHSFSSDHEDE